ncbi:MAG: hypothetical protein IJC40_02385 [Muribaculaceae bacterium]|nr:hypothetical protein [Muribaculaceae bacterium]
MNTTKTSQCVTSQCNVTDVVDCGVDYSYYYAEQGESVLELKRTKRGGNCLQK